MTRPGYSSLWPKLSTVPGLTEQRRTERLFDAAAQEAVGEVGTENSSVLRDEGAAYVPGMTVGLTGLEKTYQDELIGTPSTSVVVVNAAGHGISDPVELGGRPRRHAGADHAERTAADRRSERARGTAELRGDRGRRHADRGDPRPGIA